MDKPFVVREFDVIVSNPDYMNDHRYKYMLKRDFENLMEFIREFTVEDDNSDALEFLGIGYKRNVGEIIYVKNYVGLIEMKNGFQVEILPKISLSDGNETGDRETKKVFLKMLGSMKDFPGKVFNNASIKPDQMNLYDIFIKMYLQEVWQLVKHGLKSSYIRKEDNEKFCKGKLMLEQHIRTNFAHQERFYVSYEEFHANRPENRIIKSTLKKLQDLSINAENSKEIKQLLVSFENVDLSMNYEKDFSMVNIDRSAKDYERLIEWSRVFLTGKSFTTFSGSTVSHSLLFPMETVYESYVAQEIKKAFCPDGWSVSVQDKGYYLFTDPRKQFALRPDIVLTKNDRIIVMDTKWKRLNSNERSNYGISQIDMYQMYAYSKKYCTSEIWLLYPINSDVRDCYIKSFDSGDGTRVNVFLIDLTNISNNLCQLRDRIYCK